MCSADVGARQFNACCGCHLFGVVCLLPVLLQDKIEDVLRVDGKHITQNQLLKLGRRHLTHTEDPRRPT